MDTAHYILQHTFGYSAFRGQQADIIQALLAGEDALVVMPTGGGKSLCYQIPALARPGVAVVVSPLIALMQDQVLALRALGVNAGFINSTLSAQAFFEMENALLAGAIKILYVAPERLVQQRTLDLLAHCHLSLFAIDEAHCVAQWGHDFRADYLKLDMLASLFPQVPRIALTATADPRTQQEIIDRLHLSQAQQFIGGFDRPNIQYRIELKDRPRVQLLNFLKKEQQGNSGIVYCLSRDKVDKTAEWLREQNYHALPYHAGLPLNVREENQRRFLRDDAVIMVATIAFGMGIDKPDVRFVAHLDMPKSIEAYYQETGRAGRDGEAATALLLYGFEDVIKLRQMAEKSEGNEQFRRQEQQRLYAMLALCEMASCRRQALLGYFGDELKEPCGNCDNCLAPPLSWDATEPAQKVLSTIYRSGQRFGSQHIIDIVRGEATEKIKQYQHHELSTFGIGKNLTETQWRSVLRQLTARGFIDVDTEGFGSLRLNDSCRPILRGESTLLLRQELPSAKQEKTATGKTKGEEVPSHLLPFWYALRACRKRLADSAGVPPYVVFHDSTLKEVMRKKPQNLRQLGLISGVGDNKLKKYGDDFLAVVKEFA